MNKPFDPNKPARVIGGDPVRIVCQDMQVNGTEKAMIVLIRLASKAEAPYYYHLDGRPFYASPVARQLENIPERHSMTGHINVYRSHEGTIYFGSIYTDRDQCPRHVGAIARISVPIEFEVGEGL